MKFKLERKDKKDCTKRNLIFQIKCISCEKKAEKEIEEAYEDEEKVKEKKKEISKYIYIGETSRSAYERGYEHLEKLASLNSQSMMLRHMLDQHEKEDFSAVKWGMEIIEYKRSAFECQIKEAVLIRRESKQHNILNSK